MDTVASSRKSWSSCLRLRVDDDASVGMMRTVSLLLAFTSSWALQACHVEGRRYPPETDRHGDGCHGWGLLAARSSLCGANTGILYEPSRRVIDADEVVKGVTCMIESLTRGIRFSCL